MMLELFLLEFISDKWVNIDP